MRSAGGGVNTRLFNQMLAGEEGTPPPVLPPEVTTRPVGARQAAPITPKSSLSPKLLENSNADRSPDNSAR